MKKTKPDCKPLNHMSFRKMEKMWFIISFLYITIAFLFIPSFSFSVPPQKDTLIFGSDHFFPPYEYLNKNGRPEGFNIDIIHELAHEMNVEIIVKLGDWVQIRKELEVDGTIDFSDMFYSESRDSIVDYAYPHDIIFNKVYLHKDSPPILEISELNHKKVAVLRGSVLEEYLQAKFPEINLIPQGTESDAIRLVSEKLCDAAIVTNVSGKELLKKSKVNNVIGYGNMILPSEFCFVVKEGNTQLLKNIDFAMANLNANGTIEKLREKWFDERIFGISQYYIKLGIIVLFFSLFISYLLNFILTRRIRKSKEKLRLSEERWKFALEGSGDGVWDWNTQTNEVYYSKLWKEMLGYNENEIGNTFDEWDKRVHPDDKEQAHVDIRKHLEGLTTEYKNEHRLLCKDGTYKWIHSRGKVIEQNNLGKPLRVIGTHSDISEQINTQASLKESSNQLKIIIENTPLAIWDWNIKTDTWFATPKYYTMLGYEPESGFPDREVWLNRVHPDDRETVAGKIANVINHKDTEYSYDARMLHADGTYRWQSVIGHVIEFDKEGIAERMLGVRIDISERKKAEKELYEINEKLQAFLNNSLDAILLTSPDGIIYSANPAACKMFELSEEEICKLGRNGLVDLNDPRLLKLTEDRLKTGRASGELTMFKNGKKPFQVEISTALFKNSEGFTYSSLIIRDISERIKSQKIIRLNEERFRLISSVITDYMFESRISEKGNPELVWTFGAFESITGYTPDEFVANGGFRATIHPDDLRIDDNDIEKLQRNQNIVTELRTFTKYGKIVWIRVYAQPIWDNINQKLIGIYGAVQDITERKNIEKALTSSEEKFRKAFRTSPDSININRLLDGTFLEVNNGFEKIMGYTQEEIIGKSSITLNIWKNISERKELEKRLSENGFVENLEAEFVSKSGETKTGLLSACIIELNNEKTILSITRDITERKKIETKIRENEEHFRTIFEQSGSGMCQTSIEGKLIAVNSALCEMLSYSQDELVGIHFNSITHPDDLMIGADAVLQMKNGKTGKVVFEKRYLKKSGEIIWVHINSTLLRDENNNPNYFITQIEDITPRFEKDLALKASENKFKALVEQSLTGIYIFEEDKYIYVNSRFCEIFGYSENEIMTGMRPTDVISTEDKNRADENIKKRLSGEVQSVRYVAKGNHKSGKPLWVEIHGTHLEIEGKDVIAGTILDITDRKIAEEEIRKLNEELEEKVKDRTNELEIKISEIQRMNKLFVGRELRMKELKEKLKEIENSQRDKTNN